MSLFDLTGKVALITGSTKGIGKAIAEEMAAHGAQVVISSRKADACDAVAQSIRDSGGDATAIPCNISHKDQLENLVAESRKAYGRIDILVCNAAYLFFNIKMDPIGAPMATIRPRPMMKPCRPGPIMTFSLAE